MSKEFYALKYERKGDISFMHFSHNLHTVRCYQSKKSDPIFFVDVYENPNGRYWGWKDNGYYSPDRSELYHFIWPSEAQCRMCFAYGPEAETERGRGHLVRLSVIEKGIVS